MAKTVRVGLIQEACSSDPDANLKNTLDDISAAARKGAQIICLQELFRSPYFPQTEDQANFMLAETIPGPTTEALAKIAKQKKVAIIGSLFEKRTQGVYHNTAVVIDADGKLLGKYRKMHIPDDPRFYEKFYFTPGDLGFRTFETRYAKIGVLVCWDQWFPEAARLTALSGAEILFYPTAIGWNKEEKKADRKLQKESWETIQRSHAISNGVFVAAANRVGREKGLTFWGDSFVVAPTGECIAQASENKEEILVANCDLGKITEMRQSWPFLRDRRIDAYQAITERVVD